MKDVSRLIDKILKIDDLMPSTREDLEDFKRDIAEGELSRDDREYIIALHERLVSGGVPSRAGAGADEEEDEVDELEAGAAPPDDELAELRRALAERDARIAELERALAEARGEGAATESGRGVD